MHIIDNTTSDNHYAEIKKLSSISDELTIISPFCFFDFTNFYDQINTSQIKFIKFITTFVKNGADCYSKIGHAVTVLRWQS